MIFLLEVKMNQTTYHGLNNVSGVWISTESLIGEEYWKEGDGLLSLREDNRNGLSVKEYLRVKDNPKWL